MAYTDPQAVNPRLGSALQILSDIGLTVYDDDSGNYQRTPQGDAWLASELKLAGVGTCDCTTERRALLRYATLMCAIVAIATVFVVIRLLW
jgi:hypothetical protein